jgi:hypothetical protein
LDSSQKMTDGWTTSVLSSTDDEMKQWQRYFEKLSHKGIYHDPHYIKFIERYYYGCQAELFVYGNDRSFVYYPYFKRSLNDLPFSGGSLNLSQYYDISASWYYGGPLIQSDPTEQDKLIKSFTDSFGHYCKRSNIVAGFNGFDPNLGNHKLFRPEEVSKNRETVYVDLDKTKDTIWNKLKSGCRRNIRRAKRENITCREYSGNDELKAFAEIYHDEMIRKHAPQRLRFSHDFFINLFAQLPNQMELIVAEHQDNIIGGFIIAYDDNTAHHYLSASMIEFWALRVNDLLFYEAIMYAKRIGCCIFDFQGGRDKVFEFKKKFSPDRGHFYTSSTIYDADIYQRLIELADEAGININQDYFPKYRATQGG